MCLLITLSGHALRALDGDVKRTLAQGQAEKQVGLVQPSNVSPPKCGLSPGVSA